MTWQMTPPLTYTLDLLVSRKGTGAWAPPSMGCGGPVPDYMNKTWMYILLLGTTRAKTETLLDMTRRSEESAYLSPHERVYKQIHL